MQKREIPKFTKHCLLFLDLMWNRNTEVVSIILVLVASNLIIGNKPPQPPEWLLNYPKICFYFCFHFRIIILGIALHIWWLFIVLTVGVFGVIDLDNLLLGSLVDTFLLIRSCWYSILMIYSILLILYLVDTLSWWYSILMIL